MLYFSKIICYTIFYKSAAPAAEWRKFENKLFSNRICAFRRKKASGEFVTQNRHN